MCEVELFSLSFKAGVLVLSAIDFFFEKSLVQWLNLTHIGLLRSKFKPHRCMQICGTISVPALVLQPS